MNTQEYPKLGLGTTESLGYKSKFSHLEYQVSTYT